MEIHEKGDLVELFHPAHEIQTNFLFADFVATLKGETFVDLPFYLTSVTAFS
jgi:hypothetical protein